MDSVASPLISVRTSTSRKLSSSGQGVSTVGVLIRFGLILLLIASVAGCRSSNLKRPYGYLRLGPVAEYLGPETVRPSEGVLIRHDQNGLYAMNTYCTYDMTPLTLQTLPSGERILKSSYSSSSYTLDGQVRTGPATHPLPYFRLSLDALQIQGPRDTLYVYIGDEVSRDWRLKLP